ncbi:MAG: hypothetical protein ACRD6N_00625, partial [Pyrinomonadaceae bacterium]
MRSVVRLLYLSPILLALLLFARTAELKNNQASKLAFAVSFPESSTKESLDGRVLLLVSTDNSKEPRFQISEDPTTQQVLGVDIDKLKPGQEVLVDAHAFG